MLTRIFFLASFAFLLGCSKDEKPQPPAESRQELLTGNLWMLNAAGFDDNKNGILDDSENTIADCQQDNSYSFLKSGEGEIFENDIVCNPPSGAKFNWQLTDNDNRMLLSTQPYSIFHLGKDQMIISPDLPSLTVNFMLVYKSKK